MFVTEPGGKLRLNGFPIIVSILISVYFRFTHCGVCGLSLNEGGESWAFVVKRNGGATWKKLCKYPESDKTSICVYQRWSASCNEHLRDPASSPLPYNPSFLPLLFHPVFCIAFVMVHGKGRESERRVAKQNLRVCPPFELEV